MADHTTTIRTVTVDLQIKLKRLDTFRDENVLQQKQEHCS